VIKETADRITNIPQKREIKPLFGFLTHEEMLGIFESVDLKKKEGFRDYTVLHLMFDSGARASEVAGLKIDDFDPVEKNLGILGKGKRFRIVQLLPKTVELLELYIRKYRAFAKPPFKDRLFINQRGEALTRHGVYRICRNHIRNVLPAKRLKNLNAAHCFRHSSAVHMLMTNHSIDEIKNHLGHEDISSTMIYLKLDLSRRREVQKRFIDYMQSKIKQDPKLDDLIDWENKEEILTWLDTL
jgi:site-specific recombinase XerD